MPECSHRTSLADLTAILAGHERGCLDCGKNLMLTWGPNLYWFKEAKKLAEKVTGLEHLLQQALDNLAAANQRELTATGTGTEQRP